MAKVKKEPEKKEFSTGRFIGQFFVSLIIGFVILIVQGLISTTMITNIREKWGLFPTNTNKMPYTEGFPYEIPIIGENYKNTWSDFRSIYNNYGGNFGEYLRVEFGKTEKATRLETIMYFLLPGLFGLLTIINFFVGLISSRKMFYLNVIKKSEFINYIISFWLLLLTFILAIWLQPFLYLSIFSLLNPFGSSKNNSSPKGITENWFGKFGDIWQEAKRFKGVWSKLIPLIVTISAMTYNALPTIMYPILSIIAIVMIFFF